ncbi:MAG: hypothetical protein HZB76_04905 [Chlamydiae bacterium]|nr:hypothetical protein [Chlamydiota bacterium]
MLRFTFLMILNIAIFSLFGSEKVLIKQLNSQDSAFSQIVDGKIYLNPNRLIERDGVTYLETDALEYLPISGLFEDNGGSFVYQLSQVRNEKEEIVGYVGGCKKQTVDPKYHLVNGPETSQTIIVRKYTDQTRSHTMLRRSSHDNNNTVEHYGSETTFTADSNNGGKVESGGYYSEKNRDDGSETKVSGGGYVNVDTNGKVSGGAEITFTVSK